jgi:hypothetical protein
MLALSIALFANVDAQVVVQQQTVTTTYQNQIPGFQMNFNAWDPMLSNQLNYTQVWDPVSGQYLVVPVNTVNAPTYTSYYDPYGNLVQQQQQTIYVDQFGNPIQQQQSVVYLDQFGNPIQTQSNCNPAPVLNYNAYPQQTSVNPINAVMPMNPASFSQALTQIKQQNFESTRLTVSKQLISSNFFNSEQERQIMQQMSFESSRIEIARFAYNRVLDQQNYYVVNNAFTFSSSVDELNSYLFGR